MTNTTNAITCTGAYGRDYTTADQIKKDWNDGLDFRIVSFGESGTYMSKRDADRMGLEVWGRFNRLRDKVLLQAAPEEEE